MNDHRHPPLRTDILLDGTLDRDAVRGRNQEIASGMASCSRDLDVEAEAKQVDLW